MLEWISVSFKEAMDQRLYKEDHCDALVSSKVQAKTRASACDPCFRLGKLYIWCLYELVFNIYLRKAPKLVLEVWCQPFIVVISKCIFCQQFRSSKT